MDSAKLSHEQKQFTQASENVTHLPSLAMHSDQGNRTNFLDIPLLPEMFQWNVNPRGLFQELFAAVNYIPPLLPQLDHYFDEKINVPLTYRIYMLQIMYYQGEKKIIFTACHLGKLKLALASTDVISTRSKKFLFFCYSNSS